ncbi:MAG: hypothetical protein ACQKBU_12235 [Verrucomicrobiales bacterium]
MITYIPTCETAVSTVPEWHRAIFKGKEAEVTSSEGWSPGALNLAQGIAMKLHAPLIHSDVTRLLIDLSQHPEDHSRWSKFSRELNDDQKGKLDRRSKLAFLESIETRISDAIRRQENTIHLSIDTRTDLEANEIHFEFDSRRELEASVVEQWASSLKEALPDFKIHRSAPPTRCLSSYLREKHPELGSFKLSVSQSAFLEGKPIPWVKLKNALANHIPR